LSPSLSFPLTKEEGFVEAESLHCIYSERDDLENINDKILCENLFQAYMRDLPPLGIPEGLHGESLPDGKIRLTWNRVGGVPEYQIYRKSTERVS